MSASPLSIIPQRDGQNLADLAPLLKLGEGDKNPASSLTGALRERYLHYRDQEKPTWDEIISAGEEVAMFAAGKQFLMPNPFKPGGWLPYAVKPGGGSVAERRALSIMQYHISGNLEKWENSNPDIRVTPGVESDDAHEAAEAARIIVDHYEDKFYTSRNTQAECLEGLTFGSYIWRLRVDPTLKSVTAYRQIFENKEVKIGAGWGKCGDCPNEGSALDFNDAGGGMYSCPKCHGEAMVIPPASEELSTLTRTEPVELGDFRLDLVPIAQCRWDLRFHADESPWLIIRRRTSMSAVRQVLGNITIPGRADSDKGLDVVDKLAYSGQARAGYSTSSERKTLYKDPATVEEFWMSPDEYGDISVSQAVRTVSGQVIPAGARWGDMLKGRNICVMGLNEMGAVLGVFVEDHRDYIAQGKWYAKTGTGAGRGLQDLTEVQKVFNSDHQQTHTYLRSVATPAMLTIGDVLGEDGKGRYLGTPGMNIPIPLSALAEGVKLDQLVRPAFQPQGVPAQFFEFTYNRLSEFAQFASHFLPFASGMPGVDNKTATGANITQAATNALYTPVLSVKAEVRKLIAEKLIKLYPKHFPVERYFPLGGKYNRQSGKWLSGANLNTDLIFEVVQDSWNPRNSYTKQQSYAQVVQMFGGVLGWFEARKADPARVADIERQFDLGLESETKNVAESLCFRRVRQMQQQAKLIEDPMMLVGVQPQIDEATGQPVGLMVTGQGAIQPPVSQSEPAHELKRQWLMEWLDSDDGLESPAHLREAVELLITLHSQFATQQASFLAGQAGMIQMAGQAPMQQAQLETQAAQGQQQLEQQAQEAIGGQVIAETELRDKEESQALDQQDREHAELTKALGREHQLAVQQERQR
jgi:hypothetical protein